MIAPVKNQGIFSGNPFTRTDPGCNSGKFFRDGQLIEQSDKTAAIAQYEQEFIPNPVTESWGFYSFGIFTVSRDNQQAEVYLGIFCGPMCGIGYMYTLQRDSSAAWNITGSEIVWLV